MPFQPTYRLTPKILRQLKAIEQTTGFLKAVSLRPEWIAELKRRTLVQEALASLQIEGSSLTIEEAFELARERPDRELRDSEREFLNYLRAFEAIDGLRGARDAVLGKGDVCNLHRLLVDGVRGGRRGAGRFRREEVKVGDVAGGEVVIHHQPPSWLEVEARVESCWPGSRRASSTAAATVIPGCTRDPGGHRANTGSCGSIRSWTGTAARRGC